MNLKRLATLLTVTLISVAAGREPLLEKWRWRVFTPKNGLPERNFSALFQARNGLYYVASGNRVFQYDGYIWQELPFSQESRPAGTIRVLAEGRDGVIFAATDTEIWAFRLGDVLRQIHSGSKLVLAMSSEPRVYFLARGFLHRLEGTRVHRLQAVDVVPASRVNCLGVDGDQIVWVGTDEGLLRHERYSWEPDPDIAALGLAGRPCHQLFMVSGFRLWASFSRSENEWVLLERKGGHWRAPHPNGPTTAVLSLTGYPDGTVYASTEEGGLFRYAPGAEGWSRFPRIWPGSVVVVAGIVDDRKALWFCLSAIGIARFDARSERWEDVPLYIDLPRDRVLSLLSSRDGTIWVGTDRGLFRRAGGGNEHFVETPDQKSPLRVISGLAEDLQGRVWVASPESFPGAMVVDGDRWSRRLLPAPYSAVRFHRIYADPHGRMWLLSAERDPSGVWCMGNGALTHFGRDEGLRSDTVYDVHVAADGVIWFATDEGLVRLSDVDVSSATMEGASMRCFTKDNGLSTDRVWDLGEGKDGSIWVAYQFGGGVSRWHNGEWRHYGSRQGIANENVWSVVASPNGDIWFGTQTGVSRFDGSAFFNYEVAEDPLLSNVWPIVPVPTERGILLGTLTSGVFFFRRTDNDPPRVFPLANPAEVPFGQPVRISWAGRDRFNQTHQDDLLYLLNLDGTSWSEPQPASSFVSESLPSGRHVLTVQASDQDGNQAVFPLTIEFHVAPPWYRRPGVLVGAAAILVVLVLAPFLALRWRARAVRRQGVLEALMSTIGGGLIVADRRDRILATEGCEFPGLDPGRILTDTALGQRLSVLTSGSTYPLKLGEDSWEVTVDSEANTRIWLLTRKAAPDQVGPPEEVLNQADALVAAANRSGEPEAFPVDDAIREALGTLPAADRDRVQVTIPLPGVVWTAVGVRGDFIDVLLALVSNALEAAPEKPVAIVARNRRLGGEKGIRFFVDVEVLDEGAGLGEDGRRIYSAFHSTKEGHRGLGLTVALGLGRRNGAVVRVENRAGGGARASVLFPALRT